MPTTTNFGWTTPADTDLVKDGALAIRTLGNGIDTSMVDLKGGTTGQILSKASNTDMDFTWIANDQGDITAVTAGTGLTGGGTSGAVSLAIDSTVATLSGSQSLTNKTIDASLNTLSNIALSTSTTGTLAETRGGTNQTAYTTGDLLYASASNTLAKRGIGTTGQVLTVSGGVPTWATPAGGGKVAQVVSTTLTSTFTVGSDVYTDLTGLSVSITPTAATSKILVMVSVNGQSNVGNNYMHMRLMRGTTAIGNGAAAGSRTSGFGWAASYPSASGGGNSIINNSYNYYDSPATTSATTYKVQIRGTDASTVYINRSYTDTDNAEFLRTASTITVMEILA